MEFDVLERSRSYMQEGQLEKAQVLLRRALNSDPNSPKALELSGDLAQRMGKKAEALTYYAQAAEHYLGKNRYVQAIICFEKVTRLENTNADRYVRLANLYKQYGLPNQGLQKIIDLCSWAIENKDETTFVTGLRKIVELQPHNLHLGLSYVRILRNMNRMEQAEAELARLKEAATEQNDGAVLDEIARLSPQHDGGDEELDPKSRVELGNLLYEIGSKDEAIVEFNRAVSDLIEQGETGEAINVLNRIVEIDPNNAAALAKLSELQGGAGGIKEARAEEMVKETAPTEAEVVGPEPTPTTTPTEEIVTQEPPRVEAESTAGPAPETLESGTDIFDDLIREVETYVDSTQKKTEMEPEALETEQPQTLEGQIADIEFLLKEMETPPAPTFEVAAEFDEFRGNIIWEEEDVGKRLELAQQAFAAELYETALAHARELKINRNTWPMSLEITGAALIRLGKYSEAIKTVGPAILLEDIPQAQKIELRYLLASAYEGLGDFENALREIEHIMSTNPDYKDIKEMYELLGGTKKVTETKEEIQVTPAAPRFEPVEHPEPAQKKEEPPVTRTEAKPAEELEPEEMPEPRGENISFL
jgi:tetratricopeptide (TPR) repeat protein